MKSKTKTEQIPITKSASLVCRKNQMGSAVYLYIKSNDLSDSSTLIATSPGGCNALADALRDAANVLDRWRDE